MSSYESLWQAWTSGQIEPARLIPHLQDEVSVAWLKRRQLFYPGLRDLAPSGPIIQK